MAKNHLKKKWMLPTVRGSNEMSLQTMDLRNRKEEHVGSLRLRLEALVVCLKYSNASNNSSRYVLRVKPGARQQLKAAAQHHHV